MSETTLPESDPDYFQGVRCLHENGTKPGMAGLEDWSLTWARQARNVEDSNKNFFDLKHIITGTTIGWQGSEVHQSIGKYLRCLADEQTRDDQ